MKKYIGKIDPFESFWEVKRLWFSLALTLILKKNPPLTPTKKSCGGHATKQLFFWRWGLMEEGTIIAEDFDLIWFWCWV